MAQCSSSLPRSAPSLEPLLRLQPRLTLARDAKLAEEAAVNNLILDLAAKRAFLVGDTRTWADGELKGVVDSIFHARALMRDARLALRPRSKALPHLRRMAQECNTFIERVERDQNDAVSALKVLSLAIADEIEQVHRLRPRRILGDKPGSAALRAYPFR